MNIFSQHSMHNRNAIIIGITALITISIITVVVIFFIKNNQNASKIPQVEFSNGQSLSVLVAATEMEQQQGLSGKKTLEPYDGMLFVFQKSDRYGFWMKDMYFAIDIVWIDSDMNVVDITYNARPESYPELFRPTKPALYVLEIPAGMVKKLSIQIGSQVQFKNF